MAQHRYIQLKTSMNTYFADNVKENLLHLREKASGYVQGPSQYMNLNWYEICRGLESRGLIGTFNLGVLKEIIEDMPIGESALRDLIDSAEIDISNMAGQ
ncbi:hypothetical protein KP79_PYT22138 [Mizuhopecten yessoensis]|uniref:Uncharacterized protein n=1 Tax=Mizuhopecten yessoensis TaxID=6573 RepID=A0A210R4V8_MIZYE|nr:hypothetical protein KP79_PYT22138 [Mizuhopecten yessoensis]